MSQPRDIIQVPLGNQAVLIPREPAKSKMTSFHGQVLISHLYSVYFNGWIIGYFVGALLGPILYQLVLGKPFPSRTSIDGIVALFSIIAFITGISRIILVEMRSSSTGVALYGPGRIPLKKGAIVILSALSIYILILTAVRFSFRYFLGPASIVRPERAFPITTLDFLTTAANFSAGQNKQSIVLLVVAFAAFYIAEEYLLRGLIGGELRKWNVGAGPAILIPAFMQVLMFELELFQATQGPFFFYSFAISLSAGLLAGIVFWITKKLIYPITFTLLIHILPRGDPFHDVVMRLLPSAFGTYDPIAPPYSIADKIDNALQTGLLFLLFLSFLIPFIFTKDVLDLLSQIIKTTKQQFVGILAVIISVVVINIILYFVFGRAQTPGQLLLAFVIAAILAGIAASLIFRMLMGKPSPEVLMLSQQREITEYVMDPSPEEDIKAFSSSVSLPSIPSKFGLLIGFGFLYSAFLTATYRNFYGLPLIEKILLAFRLLVLPAIYLFFAAYSFARFNYRLDLFDSQWQKRIKISSTIILGLMFVNFTIWSSTGEIHYRMYGLFSVFLWLYIPRSQENLRERIRFALESPNRWDAIRFILRHPDLVLPELWNAHANQNYSPNARSILLAWRGLIRSYTREEMKSLANQYKKDPIMLYGVALAISLGNYSLPHTLLRLAQEKQRIVRYAAYWGLQRIGTKRIASRLARIIEREEDYVLRELAIQTLLTLDPEYPLVLAESEDFSADHYEEAIV